MWRQLKQVAVTYVTRPTPLEWVGGAGACLFYITLFHSLQRDKLDFRLLLFGYLAGSAPSLALRNHLRWQFNHPRASLTPDFRAPHVICWAMLIVALAVALPLLTMRQSPISVWPVLCCAAVAVVVAQLPAWFSYVGTPLILVVLLGNDYFNDREVEVWLRAEGFRRPLLIGVTLLAWLAAVRRVMRLDKLREDDPHYDAPVVADPNAKVSRTFRMARDSAASAARNTNSSQRTAAWIDYLIRRVASAPSWRKLDVAFDERRSPLARIADVAWPLVMFIAFFFVSNDHVWNWDAEGLLPLVLFAAGIYTAFAALTPMVRLGSRIPQMTAERLLPMSNQAYADAMLGVCLWRALRAWLLLQAVVAIVVFGLPWQGFERPSPANLAAYLVMSLAGLIYSFGVGAFCSSMQGCFRVLFAAATSALATLGLQTYWAALLPRESQGFAMFWALVFSTAGLWFAQRARLLWRHKELGHSIDQIP